MERNWSLQITCSKRNHFLFFFLLCFARLIEFFCVLLGTRKCIPQQNDRNVTLTSRLIKSVINYPLPRWFISTQSRIECERLESNCNIPLHPTFSQPTSTWTIEDSVYSQYVTTCAARVPRFIRSPRRSNSEKVWLSILGERLLPDANKLHQVRDL